MQSLTAYFLNTRQREFTCLKAVIRAGYKMLCVACYNFYFCFAFIFLSANDKIRASETSRELAVRALIIHVITSFDCGILWSNDRWNKI